MKDWKTELRSIAGALRGLSPKAIQARKPSDADAPKRPVALPAAPSMAPRAHAPSRNSARREVPFDLEARLLEEAKAMAPFASPQAKAPTRAQAPIPVVGPAGQSPATRPVPERLQPNRAVPREHERWFKVPDDWVAAGASLNLPDVANARRNVDVVIGVDFGTAYTKAAIGMLDKIYPVDWTGVADLPQRYLLPSEYSLTSGGEAAVGIRPGSQLDDVALSLKHPFLEPHVSTSSITNGAIFLALVLRYARAWVYHHHRSKLGAAGIRWHLNIGAPSNGLEQERLVRAYRRLGNAAWSLSRQPGAITPGTAARCTEDVAADQPVDGLVALGVFPEFVAQMAGYLQSPQRQRGLHALADVGGGTLDLVTFIVHKRDDEDIFPFLVPEVTAYGTQMLNQNRLVNADPEDRTRSPDELAPTLDAAAFAAATARPLDDVQTRDGIFFADLRGVTQRVLNHTKQKRYCDSDAWRTGLPFFLTGGGAGVDGYRKVIDSASKPYAASTRLMLLPPHPKLADFDGDELAYQRVSVACGLAQDAFSLGRITLAKEVEDDIPVTRRRHEQLDRDDLYPK